MTPSTSSDSPLRAQAPYKCSHRTAYKLSKHGDLTQLICTTGCGQPFWKDSNGRTIEGDELVKRLDKKAVQS